MPSCRFFFEKRGWIDSFENRGAGEAGKLMEQGQWSVTFAISRTSTIHSKPKGNFLGRERDLTNSNAATCRAGWKYCTRYY